jgi:hypothetical protein
LACQLKDYHPFLFILSIKIVAGMMIGDILTSNKSLIIETTIDVKNAKMIVD